MPVEFSVTVIYALMLLLGGFASLLHFAFVLRKPKRIRPENSLPAWNLGFFGFLIGGFMLIAAVLLVQTFTAALAPPEWIEIDTPEQIVTFGLATHLTALLALLALYKSYPEKFAEPFTRKKMSWGTASGTALYGFLVLIPIIYPVTLAWNSLLETLGVEPEAQEAVMIFAQADTLALLLPMIFLTVVLAPVSEEILFRGCLYRFIKAKTSILPALLITGLLFASLHMNLLSLLPLWILGIALAYSYELSGDLKVPILIHGIFNLNTVIVILLSDGIIPQ